MGERKVLNRYIPPDFDPSIIPKFKRTRDKLMEIRMMLPFSLRCNTCGEYMYRGKKFNSKKEDVTDETYMGIKKIRFYIKCTACSAEITFKTDPKNSDYECESGASRNFELWRDNEATIEEEAKQREEEDQYDAMKSLEHRTMDNKVEMDILDALDEIKSINSRHRKVDTEKVLDAIATKHASSSKNGGLTAEDEELLKSIKFRQNSANNSEDAKSSATIEISKDTSLNDSFLAQLSKQTSSQSVSQMPTVVIKKKRKLDDTTSSSSTQHSIDTVKNMKALPLTDSTDKEPNNATPESTPANVSEESGGDLLGLLGGYGDDDEDEA